MFNDLTKMFDPQTVSQQWQKYLDMNQAVQASKTNMESWQAMSGIWAQAYTSCYEKNMKLCQSAMEDSIECLRDLSAAKGIEDLMAKQAEWTRKTAEKCQTGAQELANTLQKTQSQCTDIISKQMSKNFQTGSEAVKAATTGSKN